eukprot:GHVU01202103.1.p2 GENE.GHVU01202103.1~~GHVU01202103.1.p2  ORF type:complete len:121 (+),score=2.19 GHVU01202103.1:260-622(+)
MLLDSSTWPDDLMLQLRGQLHRETRKQLKVEGKKQLLGECYKILPLKNQVTGYIKKRSLGTNYFCKVFVIVYVPPVVAHHYTCVYFSYTDISMVTYRFCDLVTVITAFCFITVITRTLVC